MPGLSQLKEFVNDIASLGDEVAVRTARGETVEKVVFPNSILDIDDRADFMAGIPGTATENDSENNELIDETPLPAQNNKNGEEENYDELFKSLGIEPDSDGENTQSEPVADEGGFDLGELPDTDETPSVEKIEQFDDIENFQNTQTAENTQNAQNIEPATATEEQNLAGEEFDMPDFDNFGDFSNEENMDFSSLEGSAENTESSVNAESAENAEDFEMPDFADFGNIAEDFASDTAEMAENADISSSFSSDGIDDFASFGDLNAPTETTNPSGTEKNAPNTQSEDFGDINSSNNSIQDEELPDFGNFASDTDETDAFKTDFDLDDNSESNKADIITDDASGFDLPDFGDTNFDTDTSGGFEIPEMNFDNTSSDFAETDFSNSSTPATDDFSSISENSEIKDESSDFNLDFSDLPDMSKTPEESEEFEAEENAEDMEFHIPGFSDVADSQAAAREKKEAKAKAEKQAKEAEVSDENSNSLTNKEYQQFIENLNYYPLNLRVDIENLLTSEDFTDEENMRVVRMVVKKTSVQKLAHYIGNLLGKHIDVPRNYDKRTASQYEAYKKTAEYQIKNRILPFAFACLLIFMFCASFLFLGKTFVYDPFRAELLYKEGYSLIENDYFPQSQEKFIEATEFTKKKHWFFDYANAYREKKQFGHARQMYRWILQFFPKDKRGGLQYAEMELYELNNYEEAERVVRRHVLDKFINDPDGMLLLGDIYLEWACDKDASKFELAREQYESVIDMYGQNDKYLARMLRYYIRTDNLAEVLPLKNHFYPDKEHGEKRMKALTPKDKLELSGYLLDKLYCKLNPTEEYLRQYITDVRALLELTIKADPKMPEAYYNFARYFIYTANISTAQSQLENALNVFDEAKKQNAPDRERILKNVDTYRLLGEIYKDQQEYLKAEELYTKGIALFESEKDASNLKSDANIGKLYADLADLDYFLSGDIDQALRNYLHAVENHNDNASVRYRIGYIYYANKNYVDALASFIKASESKGNDLHLLLSLGNVLALRDDNFAAQGYYERFVEEYKLARSLYSVMFPQVQPEHQDLVENYMYACNNYGVTLGNLAFRTGDSQMNAKGMVYLSESMRAWDALTRNQKTLVRLDGSNLAAQNMKYLSHRVSEYEPAMYFDIPRTLQDEEILTQER